MLHRSPAISVVIPAYNAAWSLGRTLQSLKRQTFTDFEVIVVDDGSTDETAGFVASTVQGDPRFTLIRQDNAGVSAARNRGLAAARGRYVANLDADDLWRPEFLARTFEALEAKPHVAFAFARALWIDADDTVLPLPEVRLPPRMEYRDLLLRNLVGNGSAALMRRADLEAIGGWDVELNRRYGPAEDWFVMLQLSWRGAIEPIDEPLVLYRVTPQSSSHNLERAARGALEVIRRCRALGPALPRHEYWAARSLAMIWLVRRARRTGQKRLAVWLAAQAYLRNPLWFQLDELRAPLTNRIPGLRPARMSPPAA